MLTALLHSLTSKEILQLKRSLINLLITNLVVIFGIGLSQSITAAAKAKPAKVTSIKTLTKDSYRATSGYLYSSAKLTKKVHNADNYPLTTFYTYRSANITRANGNKAVYYYIKNGNGKVKGWIWRGHLVRMINVSKRRQQINQIIGLIDTLSINNRNQIITILESMTKTNTLADLLNQLDLFKSAIPNDADIAKLNEIFQMIKSNGQELNYLFSQGINRLYPKVVAIHNLNYKVFALAQGLLHRLN